MSAGAFFALRPTSASRALTVSATLASTEADMIEIIILIVVLLLLIGIGNLRAQRSIQITTLVMALVCSAPDLRGDYPG